MANGLKEPRPPQGFQHDVLEMDPETGQLRRVDKYIPPLSPNSWWRKNFTLGNLLTMIVVLAGVLAWVRASEVADVRSLDQITAIETRVSRVEQQSMSRETIDARFDGTSRTLNAKLDGIATQLEAISKRLDRIEGRQTMR